MTKYSLAVVPGDGIGPEVVAAARQVLDMVASMSGIELEWTSYPWGCGYWARNGVMMAPDGLELLADHDSIFFGAVGDAAVPDHVSLWGLLIPIRRHFEQYVNLRPAVLLPGVASPLALAPGANIDILIVRENNEGEYSEIGGRIFHGLDTELAIQESVFSRRGIERVVRQGFEHARRRRGRLISATKSNGIVHTMPLWDEVAREIAADYPDIEFREMHVDALAALFVKDPCNIDVVVGSNLFGDILSDLAAALAGSLGLGPSGNIDPSRRHPSMFEPIHGSAPDIAGQGIANPIGQIWSGAMMLEHLGEVAAADAVLEAVRRTVSEPGLLTPDLGGSASTATMTTGIMRNLADLDLRPSA